VFGGAGGLAGTGTPPGVNGSSTGGTAGGVLGYGITCQSDIANTIIADNYSDGSSSNYFIGFADLGYNFLGTDDQKFCGFINPSTRFGTVQFPLHPLLGPLAQNGGGTPTHATTLASPVTDAGIAYPSPSDERGAPRPFDFSSVPNFMGDGSDIGAFELGSPDLGLGQESNNIIVSWPAFYGDFFLQSVTDLRSNNWSALPDAPAVVGNHYVITNHITNGVRFFRLAK
jgi:hypothetical protein